MFGYSEELQRIYVLGCTVRVINPSQDHAERLQGLVNHAEMDRSN